MIPAPPPLISVMEVLAQCGWVPDPGNVYSEAPALKYNFGNLEVSAGRFTNEYQRQVVTIAGHFNDYRSLAEIAFDIPERVASRAQALAWVVYGIGERIPLAITPEWFDEGRRSQDQLAWRQHLAEYERRPQAAIGRDWMRVLAKQLKSAAAQAVEAETCEISFDGDALRFRLPGRTLLVQASGDGPWTVEAAVRLSDLTGLPARWMTDPVHVSLWEGHFVLGNRRFSATTIEPRAGSASKPVKNEGGEPK